MHSDVLDLWGAVGNVNAPHSTLGGVTVLRRQRGIVSVSCRAAAEEGRAIGNVQPCADP